MTLILHRLRASEEPGAIQEFDALYIVEARIDNDTIHLSLPDGTSAKVVDARIATFAATANVACWEMYQTNTGSEKAAFHRVWADTEPTPLGVASLSDVARIVEASGAASGGSTYLRYAPAYRSIIALGGPATAIPGITVTHKIPDSGKIRIDIEVFVNASGAWFIAGADIGTLGGGDLFRVSPIGYDTAQQSFVGTVRFGHEVIRTPGELLTIVPMVACPIGSANVILDDPFALYASITVTNR